MSTREKLERFNHARSHAPASSLWPCRHSYGNPSLSYLLVLNRFIAAALEALSECFCLARSVGLVNHVSSCLSPNLLNPRVNHISIQSQKVIVNLLEGLRIGLELEPQDL